MRKIEETLLAEYEHKSFKTLKKTSMNKTGFGLLFNDLGSFYCALFKSLKSFRRYGMNMGRFFFFLGSHLPFV